MCALVCSCVISAEITTVICDKMEKAQVLLDNVARKETPGLQQIILMDAFDSALVKCAKDCNVHVQSLQEVEVWYLKFFKSLFPLTLTFGPEH